MSEDKTMNTEQMRIEFEKSFVEVPLQLDKNSPEYYAEFNWRLWQIAWQAALQYKSVPDDATPEMIKAGLKINFNDADLEGTLHNLWHAMLSATLQQADKVRELEGTLAECKDFLLELNQSGVLTGESRLHKHLVTRMEALYHAIEAMKGE